MDKKEVIYKELSYNVVGCLFEVFRQLGPNHREKTYQKAISIELTRQGIPSEREKTIDVKYKNERLGKSFFDFDIDGKIILEIKTANCFRKQQFEQVLEYLKISGCKLGRIGLFTKEGVKFFRVLNNS